MAAGHTGRDMGRPVALDYSDDDMIVQLNAHVPAHTKRAMAERAARADRTLKEEARLAFEAWIERDDETHPKRQLVSEFSGSTT
jgi:hypothetical protein